MFITKKHLSRRTVLKGAGVSIALPLLDAMIPAGTAIAQTAAAAKPRLAFIYFPHGAIMDHWTPTTEGKDFEISPILKPLEPFKNKLTIVSGLENRPGMSSTVHAIVPGTWLTCVHPRETPERFGGISIDQMAASKLGQDTPLPSLEVAMEAGGAGGACDRLYGCSNSSTISYRTATTPLPMEYNPRKLFQRLFGRGDSADERAVLASQYNSMLDMVADDAASLKGQLGARDRAELDDYLETVREIERRVEKATHSDVSKVTLPAVPPATMAWDDQLKLMFDIMGIAYQANLTRIVNFMMAAEVSGQTYNQIQIPDAFHPLSHHANDPAKITKLIKLQTYHSEHVARFLKKLQDMPDGDGSMYDHLLMMYGSNMSNSDRHNQFPLPISLIGGACGKVKGGQHLKYADKTPLSNLLLTVLDRAGSPVDHVGDSTTVMGEV
ncbi:MAG: DUF1552 domain-containing protein [Pseudomonadota bacterium]